MASATIKIPEQCTSLVDKAVGAYRKATDVARDAREFTNMATDAVDDGVHAAKRALRTARRQVANVTDWRDEAVYRVKRQPLRTIGLVFGVGVLAGVVIHWASHRCRQRTVTGE